MSEASAPPATASPRIENNAIRVPLDMALVFRRFLALLFASENFSGRAGADRSTTADAAAVGPRGMPSGASPRSRFSPKSRSPPPPSSTTSPYPSAEPAFDPLGLPDSVGKASNSSSSPSPRDDAARASPRGAASPARPDGASAVPTPTGRANGSISPDSTAPGNSECGKKLPPGPEATSGLPRGSPLAP